MRCGVYVRVSTDDQRDNGYSIDSQLQMIKEKSKIMEMDSVQQNRIALYLFNIINYKTLDNTKQMF